MREGDWLLVELYDTGDAELYNLADDIGERHDLAATEPDRLAAMRAALDAYRRANAAQLNTPNPDFDPHRFHSLYVDPDPSRFDPATATAAEWDAVHRWRKRMDASRRDRTIIAPDFNPGFGCK
jgi:arylsulfatase A